MCEAYDRPSHRTIVWHERYLGKREKSSVLLTMAKERVSFILHKVGGMNQPTDAVGKQQPDLVMGDSP